MKPILEYWKCYILTTFFCNICVPYKPVSKHGSKIAILCTGSKAMSTMLNSADYIVDKVEYSPKGFLESFSKHLPRIVKVTKGYYGEEQIKTFEIGQVIHGLFIFIIDENFSYMVDVLNTWLSYLQLLYKGFFYLELLFGHFCMILKYYLRCKALKYTIL